MVKKNSPRSSSAGFLHGVEIMGLKKNLERRIRGWLPKKPNLPSNKVQVADAKTKVPKPGWWRPLWIATLLLTIASGFIIYFLLNVSLERTVSAVALTFFCIGIAYYIRVRPSMRVNRAIYILLGISPIGFGLWIIWAASGIGRFITNVVGALPSLLISWAACYGIGAFIGDWIGKRRNYQLPLSP
jgi:hypothetical protein